MKAVLRYINDKYVYFLLGVFLATWVWSIWKPASHLNWFLENKMVLLFIPIIYLLLIRYIRFSKLSLTLVTIFLLLHIVGAHYNYGSVPFGYTLGNAFGAGGNMYDKLVHFSFGFFISYPIREFFLRVAKTKGFWGYLLPFNMILAMGALYETFEWITVLRYGEAAGYLFIGGNDPFDTTKDLTAAALGSLFALSIVLVCEAVDNKEALWRSIKSSFAQDSLSHPKEDRLLHRDII